MYIIICKITNSIATTDHCWARVVCMRTIRFETEKEAQAYVIENKINNIAITEESRLIRQ